MASQFGGIPLNTQASGSRFGGVPLAAPAQQPPADNRILADEPGYTYGDILPFKKNVATGQVSPAFPEMIRSPVRGMQDIQNQAQGEAAAINRGGYDSEHPIQQSSPDAVNAMATMLGTIGPKAIAAGNAPSASETVLPAFIRDQTSGPPAAPTPLTVDMLNKAAPNAYKFVDSADTGFTTNFGTKASNFIEQAKEKPIAGMELTSEQAAINKALDEYKGLGSRPLPLADYQKLDSTLGNKAAQAYIASDSNKARIIGDVQDKIRNMVSPENLDASHITGSHEGINTLTQDAIPMWSVKRKIEDLQAIVDNANMTKNPQTAMMTGFKNYIKSGRADALPPEVQQLVQQMATQGTGADLLSIVGSRLNPIVAGAAGGPAAGIVAQGTSLAARAVGNRIVNNRADAIISSMLEQVRPSIEKFHNYQPPPAPVTPPAAPMLALPAPKEVTQVNSYGQAIPLTPAGRDILGQSAGTAAEQAASAQAAHEATLKSILQPERPLLLPAPAAEPRAVPQPEMVAAPGQPPAPMTPQQQIEAQAARQNPENIMQRNARADQTPPGVLNTELRQQMNLRDSQTAWDKAFGNLANKYTYKEIINKIGERPKP